MITRHIYRALILSVGLLTLQACGQSGDLYLPGEAPPSQLPPVKASPSPTAEPTPAPAPQSSTRPEPETTP
jgi:predicted small lipoprotein YifL